VPRSGEKPGSMAEKINSTLFSLSTLPLPHQAESAVIVYCNNLELPGIVVATTAERGRDSSTASVAGRLY